MGMFCRINILRVRFGLNLMKKLKLLFFLVVEVFIFIDCWWIWLRINNMDELDMLLNLDRIFWLFCILFFESLSLVFIWFRMVGFLGCIV